MNTHDLEALVKTIAAEVLRQLPHKDAPPAPATPVLRVLAPRSKALAEKLAPLGPLAFNAEAGQGSRHILPWLSCADMADLALGRASQSLTYILDLLLRGVHIEVMDWEYLKYAQSAPAPLFKLYSGYAATLGTYGMHPFHEQKPGSFSGKLLTEKHVLEAHAAHLNELSLPSAAIITPQAADTAKNLHITLKREAAL